VSVTISPIKDDSGRVIGASKIVRDISDRKRMEQLLVESEKLAAAGQMAATIAHEINNPLEALLNLIYLARQNSDEDSTAHEYLLTAEHELERVSHIARETLDYYRKAANPEEIHLHCILENVLMVYRSKLESQGISVVSRFADTQKISVLKGDMVQVFSNIIANSIDAMSQGGKIHIYTDAAGRSAGKGIRIVIRDQGIGIPQQHIANVFEPFFTTKGRRGTGVGLWVAKQLIEKRGGEIGVTSNTKAGNNGTEVTIFLPFDARASNAQYADEILGSTPGKLRQ
jgi:signal transduction histidine kinase